MFVFNSEIKFVDRKIGICENLMFSSESGVLTKDELACPEVLNGDVNVDCGGNCEFGFESLKTTTNKLIKI